MSVWICKEQAFRLVCRMVLPYTLSKKKERIREGSSRWRLNPL